MVGMEKNYAPIIIVTLCRYEHLTRCIESLSHCTGAENTDVYIGLDYPLNKSHWEGYNLIRAYLTEYKKNNIFRSFNIIFREFNLGASGNVDDLIEMISKQYDRWIFTEDDNIFSPNFLVYINKGLELYKEDKSVFAISGYRNFYPIKFGSNTFFRQNVAFSAWGYAVWRERHEMCSRIDANYFRKTFSFSTFLKLRKQSGNYSALFYFKYAFSNGYLKKEDNLLSVFAAINGMDIIMPTISLVRNIGVDGSGEHFKMISNKLRKLHDEQIISEDCDFEYIGTGMEFYEENRKIFRDSCYGKISSLRLIIRIIKFFINRKL